MFYVDVMEFERGWGSRVDETKSFATREEADKFVNDFNSQNTDDPVPDWYMVAVHRRN